MESSNKSTFLVFGIGNFAKHTHELLTEHDIDHVGFVDRQNQGEFLGLPIFSPRQVLGLFQDGQFSKVLFAVSNEQISRDIKLELTGMGIPAECILELLDDNALTLLESLLRRDRSQCLQKLTNCQSLIELEKTILQGEWQACLSRIDNRRPTLGIGFYGKGGGFSAHILDLFSSYEEEFNLIYLTDDLAIKNKLPRQTSLLVSNVTAKTIIDIDIAVSAHFIPFYGASTIKLTFMHVIYDYCLAPQYVAACINTSKEQHIFVPSAPCYEWFQQLRIQHSVSSDLILHQTGYPKLDNNRAIFRQYQDEVDAIIYAPTLSSVKATHHELSYSLFFGKTIIETLLHNFPAYTILFRPHPSDAIVLSKSKSGEINKQYHDIIELSRKYPRLRIDLGGDYMKSYCRSAVMISDTSSTAFTYAFTTSRPVVFYCPRNDELLETLQPVPRYLHDRERVGLIAETPDALVASIKSCLESPQQFQKKIESIRDETIYHLDTSQSQVQQVIESCLQSLLSISQPA